MFLSKRFVLFAGTSSSGFYRLSSHQVLAFLEGVMSKSLISALKSAISVAAIIAAFFAGTAPSPVSAQATATDARTAAPVPLAPAAPSSPQVSQDGTADFHLVMPNAAKVRIESRRLCASIPNDKGIGRSVERFCSENGA